MRWHAVDPIDRQDAVNVFATGTDEAICETLVRCAFHDPDWRWVQAQCLRLAGSDVVNIKKTTITSLAHVARIHGTLDLAQVIPILSELSKDPELSGHVDDALEDIRIFVRDSKTT